MIGLKGKICCSGRTVDCKTAQTFLFLHLRGSDNNEYLVSGVIVTDSGISGVAVVYSETSSVALTEKMVGSEV